jgi:hypothetical protein
LGGRVVSSKLQFLDWKGWFCLVSRFAPSSSTNFLCFLLRVSLPFLLLLLLLLPLPGIVPPSIGKLFALKQLGWQGLGLRGTIPSSFKNLTDLVLLQLVFHDNITAIAPDAFSNLTRLSYLDFEFNFIQSIPQSVSLLPSLYYLRLTRNAISTIQAFPSLSRLRFLDLTNNSISLPLPSFNNWKHMEILKLGDNFFYGTLQSDYFNNMPLLSILDLSSNLLVGRKDFACLCLSVSLSGCSRVVLCVCFCLSALFRFSCLGSRSPSIIFSLFLFFLFSLVQVLFLISTTQRI